MNPATEHLEGKLLDYAYGELSEGEAKTVEAHLRACPQCAESLTAMKQVRRTMSQLPLAPAPQAGLESLMAYAQKAADAARARPARGRRWLRWVAPLASVAALSVVLVISGKVMQRSLSVVSFKQDARGEIPRQIAVNKVEKPAKAGKTPAKETDARLRQEKVLAGGAEAPETVGAPNPWATPPKDWNGSGGPEAPAAAPLPERIAQRADKGRADDVEVARKAKLAALPKPEPARRAASAEDDSAARDIAGDELQAGAERRFAREGGPAGSVSSGAVGGVLGAAKAQQPLSEVATPHTDVRAESKRASGAAGAARSLAPSSPPESAADREREVVQLRQALAGGAQGQERARLLRRLCDVLDTLGRTRDADSACDTVVREFPTSEEAKSARERLKVRAAERR